MTGADVNREHIEAALAEALAAIRASRELRPVAAAAVFRQVQADCDCIHRALERQLMLLEALAPDLTTDGSVEGLPRIARSYRRGSR